jgi:type II secretory pathway component PulF
VTSLGAALRELRRGRDKSAHYRMWQLRQHAGLSHPEQPAPGRSVPFETALVKVGEESGKLEECLQLLAVYFAAEDRMVRTVVRKAAYPMFTLLAATFIAPLPLLFSAAGSLAYVTTVTAGLALWLLGGGSLLLGVVRWYLAQPKYVLGRLLRALTIAVETGLPLGRAAELAAAAAGNDAVLAHVRSQGALAASSQPLSRTFAGCPFVPPEALASMEVAEATGNYGDTLARLADLYER